MKQSSLFKCQKTKLWNTVFKEVMNRFSRQAEMKQSSLFKCQNQILEHSFRESHVSI